MLITQCPHCSTVFEATVDALMRGGGRTRCGSCGEAFDALVNLRDGLPQSGDADQGPGHAPGDHGAHGPSFSRSQVATLPGVVVEELSEEDLLEELSEEARPREPQRDDVILASRDEPVFDLSDLPPLDRNEADDRQDTADDPPDRDAATPEAPPRKRQGVGISSTLVWGAGCILLTLALLAQGMVPRQTIANFPPLHDFAEKVCEYTGCRMPLPRQREKLSLVSRDVQPHPSVEGALQISATMINRADRPQEWPTLEISLADLNGTLLTMRRFGPESYLSSGMSREAGMPPNTPIYVVFETEDPGNDAVAFEFRFR